MTQATAKIRQLRPVVKYSGITAFGSPIIGPAGSYSVGFVSGELDQVIPYSVITTEDGKKLVDYNMLLPYVVAAMQEQQAYIETLEQRIQILERR